MAFISDVHYLLPAFTGLHCKLRPNTEGRDMIMSFSVGVRDWAEIECPEVGGCFSLLASAEFCPLWGDCRNRDLSGGAGDCQLLTFPFRAHPADASTTTARLPIHPTVMLTPL
jgi:hypothetical protein